MQHNNGAKTDVIKFNNYILNNVHSFIEEKRKKLKDNTINRQNPKLTFLMLSFATYNINRIKSNRDKLFLLIDSLNDIDIISFNETNILKKEHINKKLKDGIIYYSKKTNNKYKDSGVVVYMKYKWAKHVKKIDNPNNYTIMIILYFKQCNIVILQIYMPSNDADA